VNRGTGDIYVGSASSSTNLPVTGNALQPGPGGGGRDGLVARYSNSGTLLSLTYMGGSGTDRFEGILVGSNGNVFVSGIGQDIYGSQTVQREVYAIRSLVRSGNSGGPLIDTKGQVLGIVFATARDSPDTGFVLTNAEVAADAAAGRTGTAPVSTSACTP